METLGKTKEVAPFTDVIEKGIQLHLNCQNRKQSNKNNLKQNQAKETKEYNYNPDKKESRGGVRPSSQLQKRPLAKVLNKG